MNERLKIILEELRKEYEPKDILEAAKRLYKNQIETKNTWLPSVRCNKTLREDTERCAKLVKRSMTEYITEAVEYSNHYVNKREEEKNL